MNSIPDAQNTNEDTTVVFSTGKGNLISISDMDAGSNPVRVTLTWTTGTVTLSGTTGLTFSASDGTDDATMTFTGTSPNINTALAGLRFSSTPNFNGAANLKIVTHDQANTGYGETKSDTDNVAIIVTPVNNAPTLAANPGSAVARGGTEAITTAELQVTDTDNTPAQLTYTVTVWPVNGQLELMTFPGIAIMTFTQAQIDAGQVVYVPNGSFNTDDGFTFTASDGAGGNIGAMTFGITVTPFNSIPTLGANFVGQVAWPYPRDMLPGFCAASCWSRVSSSSGNLRHFDPLPVLAGRGQSSPTRSQGT